MASTEKLEQWWAGLSAAEKADALRARDAGRLSDRLDKSLQRSGLIGQGESKGRTIPSDVTVFLKTRH